MFHTLEMDNLKSFKRRLHDRPLGALVLLTAAALMTAALPRNAAAETLYNGSSDGNDLEINLDTTVEYSAFYRVNDPSAILTSGSYAGAGPNFGDGDSNFRHGLVSNEFEAVPVFDLKYGNFGAHVSGQFYLNTVYLQQNQNNAPAALNAWTPARTTDFTSATRNVNGENALLLDAFAYGSRNFGADGNQTLTVKLGRQTLLWGQSLFFTNNGIAAGQAPINILTADSTPNVQAQQVFLPVGQAVVTYQPNQILTLQAYYQFEWEHDLFEGAGAYFSNADFQDKGGQRIIFGHVPFGPDVYLYRIKGNTPPIQNGQFGASVQATLGNYDVGVYALRYDAKAPEVEFNLVPRPTGGPGINAGSYWLVYPRDIQIYGASVSTTIGAVNVAGEVSGRRNMPLVGLGINYSPSYPGGANNNTAYATGSTMAAQVSAIYVSPGLPLDPGGVTMVGEFAMNHVLAYDKANKAALTPGRDSSAGAFQFVITPTYFLNILQNLELQFPIGMEYGLFGRSQIDQNMNHGTGSVNVGITATYLTTWTAGLTYNDYLGAPNPAFNDLADRGYVSFNIEHTF
jgi:hypothetical protein